MFRCGKRGVGCGGSRGFSDEARFWLEWGIGYGCTTSRVPIHIVVLSGICALRSESQPNNYSPRRHGFGRRVIGCEAMAIRILRRARELIHPKPVAPQNVTSGRIEIERDGKVAYLEYSLGGNVLELIHT